MSAFDLSFGGCGTEDPFIGVGDADGRLEGCLEECTGGGGGGKESDGSDIGACVEAEPEVARACRNDTDACFLDKTGCN